ncbi:hypothetical protein [Clostridium sp. ZS2-4]|uniref:hypothetical protein n=1 Tax=Clostridium sp. ZS2-4 TaxID=2987703 RepID=UPI00227C6660|nr:hypothetical protein [Clostridium sp. ZS2-4]MCY6353780.1 hypothetical protein [Clostridium sp. ZS2-4]
MFLNKNVRYNTLLSVVSLNTILIIWLGFLFNKITTDNFMPNIILIIIITAIFIISGIILLFKTPVAIQEYDDLMDTLKHKKENYSIEEIKDKVEIIKKKTRNWTMVYNVSLVIFVLSFIYYIYLILFRKTDGIDIALLTWIETLLGVNCISWKFSRDSLNKLVNK